MDRTLTGIPASPGIVIGPVHLLLWEVPDVATRILVDDDRLKLARLALATAVRHVLRNGLTLLGVSAPEKM